MERPPCSWHHAILGHLPQNYRGEKLISQERPAVCGSSCYYFRSICGTRNRHKHRGFGQIRNRLLITRDYQRSPTPHPPTHQSGVQSLLLRHIVKRIPIARYAGYVVSCFLTSFTSSTKRRARSEIGSDLRAFRASFRINSLPTPRAAAPARM